MQHVIVYLVITEQLERLKSSVRGYTVKFVVQFLIPLTTVAQENPWEHQTQGENPWGGTAEKTVVISKEEIETVNATETADTLLNNSEVRTFVMGTDTIQFNANDEETIKKQLIRYGNDLEKSNANLFVGLMAGTSLNLLGFPIGVLSGVPETPKSKASLEEFQQDNPNASEDEVKYVKRGLQKKRITKAFVGSLGGFLLSTAMYVGILIAAL